MCISATKKGITPHDVLETAQRTNLDFQLQQVEDSLHLCGRRRQTSCSSCPGRGDVDVDVRPAKGIRYPDFLACADSRRHKATPEASPGV